jgi:hypothetical protein
MLKRLILILALLAFARPALADVARNDSGNGTNEISATGAGGVTSIDLTTFSVSAGSNRCLVAFLLTEGAVTGTSVNWDQDGTPQAMTSRKTQSGASGFRFEAFSLVAPTVGNLKLHAQWTTSQKVHLLAIAFSGADQSTCVATADSTSNTGSGTSVTLAITSSSDGATAAMMYGNNVITNNFGTEIFNNSDAISASFALGGTTNNHSWTVSGGGGEYSSVGVHVSAAGGGGGGSGGRPLLLRLGL